MKTMRVHRLIAVAFLNNPDGKPCIDHINNNKLNNNNNMNNLRQVTHTENNRSRSMRNDNSSGVKGVSWDKKANKWYARIQFDGIRSF